VYSKSLYVHVGNLRLVISILKINNLFGNIDKCAFCVKFYGQ